MPILHFSSLVNVYTMGKVEEISSQLHYHECMFLGCYSLEDISPILSEHIGTCVMCLLVMVTGNPRVISCWPIPLPHLNPYPLRGLGWFWGTG